MTRTLQASEFTFEYTESRISDPVLCESHCHAKFELIAVLAGDVSVMREGRNYRLTEGQAILIPPLSYHTVTANQKGSYHRITALLEREAIPAVLLDALLQRRADSAVFSSSRLEELRRICLEKEPAFYLPLAYSLIVQMLYRSLRETSNDTATADPFLREVISYIDAHLEEKISLSSLAKHTSRSSSSLSHLFEEKMHISPKQYILQKKLALANKLIGEGVPPTVAAMRVGYESYSNFYRMYLKHFGKTPKETSRTSEV